MKKIFLIGLMVFTLFGLMGFAQAYEKDKDNDKDNNKKASVTVLSPNGGEIYQVGQQMNISWNSKNTKPNMTARIYLVYTPTGISTTIGSGPAVSGSFSYTIPGQLETIPGPLPSGKFYKIRVDILDHNQRVVASDSSDQNFTINNPTITVTYPNGGEVYQPDQQIRVTWTSTNMPASDQVNIMIGHFSPAGGGLCGANYIANLTLSPTLNDGVEIVTLPTQYSGRPLGNYFKIIVVKYPYPNNAPIYDCSDNLFTVNNPASVTVTTDPNTPPAGTVLVNNTASTNNVPLLKFQIKATNSDLTLKKIAIQVASNPGSVSSKINTIKLFKDNTILDSIDGTNGYVVSGGVTTSTPVTSAPVTGYVFGGTSPLNTVITSGTTQSFTVTVDIKALAGNYNEGDTLTASFTNGDVLLPSNFSILDNNGDQLNQSQRSGYAQGQTQILRTSCLNTVMGGTSVTSTLDQNGNVTMLTYSIPLTVTACGGNRYIGQTAELATTASGTNALAYVFNVASNPTAPDVASIASSIFSSNDAAIEGNGYRIDNGTTKHFNLIVALITPSIPNSNYRVALKQIRAFTDGMLTTGATNFDLLPESSYQTQFALINN